MSHHTGSLNAVDPTQKDKLKELMREYDFIEVWWADNKTRRGSAKNIVAYTEGCGFCGGGKTVGQGGAFPSVWGVLKFFTDANAAFRIEEVARMPYSLASLSEFVEDRTDYVLYGEHVFPQEFSIQAKCICLADETWTRVVQRFLNMSGACSFYGHSGVTYKNIVKAIDGTPHDYPSEDIVLGMRLWINGFKTDHKEHCLFGKSRPTGWHENLAPFAKYPAGGADLTIGHVIREVIKSKKVTIAQKMLLFFTLSFYYRKELVYFAQALYLHLVVLLGVSGFITFPFALLFGILGIIISQGITTQEWLLLKEKHGFLKGTGKWIMNIPANFVTFLPYVFIYVVATIVGLLGRR